jgi:hypothetical protein
MTIIVELPKKVIHSKGESTPPCGHCLAMDAPKVSPDNLVYFHAFQQPILFYPRML